MFSEATDWCYRFHQAGWRVFFFPGAEAVHVGGASHGGSLFAENVRGHLRFLAKHRGTREAERARRLLLAGVRLRLLLFRGERRRSYREAARLLVSGDRVHGHGSGPGRIDLAKWSVVAAGIGFGITLWYVAVLDGDAFFHLARVRKLEVFGSLSLQNVGEFKDGSLHPGYAFPLWHGFLALVARLADVDPIAVGRNGPTALAPLAFALFYEAGAALFRSAWAGVAVVIAQISLTGIAAGHGGAFTSLALPATVSRQLLVPGLLALFFAHVRRPSQGLLLSTAAAAGGLALVHPTYALFVGVPLVGFAIAR